MAKVIALPAGVLLSLRQFADESGRDRDTIGKRVKAAGLNPAGKRGGHPVYRLRDLLQAAYVTDDDGQMDPDRLDPFARHAFYKGEREKMQLQVERSELLSSLEVEQRFAAVFKAVADCLDTLPDLIERDCAATPMQVERIQTRLDEVREDLYERLNASEDEDAGGTAEASA